MANRYVSPVEEGARFGRLTVMLRTVYNHRSHCICVCDCGESKSVRAECLARGWTRSCGCHRREFIRWNKGIRGIHQSPSTEWKKGCTARNKMPVGSETIRKDKGNGAPRVYRKVADPNVWRLRAVIVWEELNGPVPKGRVIHHRDRNSLNDDPKNLQCLTRSEHASEHARDLAQDSTRIEA